MPITHLVVVIFAGSIFSVATQLARAQEYPSKPIRIVVAPGPGTQDFLARLLGPAISALLGQQVIVDNRPAILGAETVAKAPPDGYSLLMSGNLWVGPLMQKLSYDAARDFSPISILSKDCNVLVVHPSVPAKSVKDLITLAKAKPGELNYAATSIGGGNHLAAELFKALADVNVVRVTFKGTGEAIASVISGEVHLIFAGVTIAPHIKAGKLRALAVTSAEPSPFLPGLQPMSATLPGYESIGINGIYAPARTPAAIIKRLNEEIVRAINQPDVKERLLSSMQVPVASSSEQLAATVRSEMITLAKLIKQAGIRVE